MRVNDASLSQTAQRAVYNNNRLQEETTRQLSSGDRITTSAVDPSGLAITEKMRSHIKSMRQANRNTQEAISMFQVAEGALGTIASMAVRLKELSMQAANDTFSDTDRASADIEYQNLKNEIRRVSKGTNYNGQYLLNNSGKRYDIQVGIFGGEAERIGYDLSTVIRRSDTFGGGATNVRTKAAAQNAIMATNTMVQEISSSRAQVGSLSARMTSTIQNNLVADQNLSDSKSKIRDTDFAYTAAENARASIMKDSSITSLKAANISPTAALRLVG